MTGISRGTIRYWKNNNFEIKHNGGSCNTNNEEYSFLLGFYLGDGYIVKFRRTYKLSFYNSLQYENINKHIEKCLGVVFPDNKHNRVEKIGCWDIYIYNSDIPKIFPQHGKGKKHERNISLEEWQRDIIKKYPESFIKGLMYSDGCIVEAKYKRFEFSNRSMDIHNILTEALIYNNIKKTSTRRKVKDVKHPQYNQYITTISKKEEVEKMNKFIPNKS